MGFGRSTFQDMHFSGAARDRQSGVYSDDEYESMSKTDKRTKPKSGMNDQKWKYDETAGERFWQDVEGQTGPRKGGTTRDQDYAKQVWDEFDDFFDFNKQGANQQESPNGSPHGLKDETKGTDYKANVDIEFMDSFKGLKTVS
jgi:hypothetical protein